MTEDPSKSVMPHALGIEKSVLSVILQFPEVADEAPQLTSEHFHIPAHRILFERVQAIRNSGQQVELVGLVQDLLSSGLLDNCGGPAAVYDIFSYQPSPTSFPAHVARLSEHRAFRAAVRQAERLEAAAMSHDAEILAERLTEANTAILDALTDGAPAPPIGSIVEQSMAAFEQRVMGADIALGIPLIPELDEHLRGAHPGRLWVIGAYPEGGKSVIASQMVIDAARDGTQCLFLTMEMAERDLMDRMIVQAARCDARAFTEPKDYARDKGMGAPSGELLKAIKRAAMTIRDSPIRLQRPANRKLVLSQLNADGETKHGRVIEEDADAVIRIVQDRNKESDTYKQHRHISIDKDRHYGSGGSKVPLILDRERIRFVYGEDQSQSSKPKFRR
jgi:replicative DNA helicase